MFNTSNKYSSSSAIVQQRRQLNPFLRKLKITSTDLIFIALLATIGVYFLVKEPLLISVLSAASITFFGLWQITKAVPVLEKLVGRKIRFWHVATAIIAVAAFLSTFETPAQAIFLSGLEKFMTDIAQKAGGNGGTAISADTIKLIFNAIRGVFLLLVAAAALFAYNQAQQGNDWRPIVTQIGLAFGIVIAIDVVTQLFIGDGTGGSAASGGFALPPLRALSTIVFQ